MSNPILVKCYARNRFYSEGRYVSVDHLRAWLVDGLDFVVIDTETGDDVTRVLFA